MALDPTAVSNEIQSTMSLARQQANSMIGAASAQLTNAVSVLNQYQPDFPTEPFTPVESGISMGGSGFDPGLKPPSFPTIRAAQEVRMGALGDLDTLDATFEAEAPNLQLPSFSYQEPAALAPFTKSAPTINSAVTVPDAPTITYPDLPRLLALDTNIPLADLVMPSLAVEMPAYNNLLSGDFATWFSTATGELPDWDQYGMQLVERFYPGLLAGTQQLIARVSGILGRTETALSDIADTRLYEQLKTRVLDESGNQLGALDDASLAAGWAMPGRARLAGASRIRQAVNAELGKAALDVYARRTERELQHLQFVMGLAAQLQGAAASMFGQAVDVQLRAFASALQFAQTAMQFSIAVYQLKQRDFELRALIADKQIAIFRALMDAELSKVEVSKARIAVESLKSNLNRDLIAQYTAQLQGEETKARLYESQIKALEATIQARKLPLDVFLAEIKGFSALAAAKKDEYALIEAKIRGDEAKTRGELAKLEVYKTEADVFSTVVSAKSKKIEGQIQRNRQIMEEFKIKQDAEVQLTEIDAKVAEHALRAYEAAAQIYIAESQERLAEAKLDLEKAIENARLELEDKRFAFEKQFKLLEMEMTRVKAVADINLSTGQVQGHIGAAAMSIMNSMVELSASVSG